MEEKNLTPETDESGLKELLDEAREEITEKTAEVKEELGELAEEVREEAAEAKEKLEDALDELKEEAAELKEEVAEGAAALEEKLCKKGAKRLFLGAGMLEWVSTFAFCSVILHAGYLLGEAVQSGASGLGLITTALSNWYSCVYMVMLAVFGVLTGTVAKKKGTLCLLAPTVLYIGLTVYNLIRPVSLLVALAVAYARGDTNAILMGTQLLIPLLVMLIPYLLQLAALISFAVRLFGRGNRWVHMVLSVLWAAGCVVNVLLYLEGTFTQCAPQYMLALEFVATGLLVGVTGFAGTKIAKADYAALRDADAAEYAAKNAKKSKKAEVPAEESVEEPAAAEEVVEEAAAVEEAAEEVTEAPAAEEAAAEESSGEETPAEETPVEETPVEETPVED